MTQHYDIIINGAGMVGTVTALLLAEQGYTVALVEAREQSLYSRMDSDHLAARHLRVAAISKHNLDLFERLGISQHWHHNSVGYYQHMQVWDNHSTGEIEFNSDSQQVLGAIIENQQTIAAAQRQANEHSNIDVYYKSSMTEFDDTGRKVCLNLEVQTAVGHTGEGAGSLPLSGYLLLGADGARSQVRTQLGIESVQKSYQQHGLVAYLTLEKAPNNTALQAFNQGGPVGLLPMNDGLFSMVWSLPDDQVEHWLKADESYFVNGLKAHINRDFGHLELCSERAAFPLNKAYAKAFYRGRVALLGDAAHTIHPLAGQGVNLGFADAECLVEKLNQVALKDSAALAHALKKYQRVRLAEVHKTSETMHALHHLFTSHNAAIKGLRAFGMNRLNQIKPIKQWLLSQAGS